MSATDISKAILTTIHTRINDKLRISSVYRKYENEHFEQWAWETYLWENDNVHEEYDTCSSANEVLELHVEIFTQHKL